MDQYKMMSKVGTVLTEATPEKTSETANNIVKWFEQPGVKAAGYILGTVVIVSAIAFIVYHAYKKVVKR